MTPIYELSLGNTAIQNRLKELEIRDFAEQRGDTIDITINGKGIEKPRLGVPLSIKIGYAETSLWDAGTFIIQEVQRSMNAKPTDNPKPNLLTIRGISQPQGTAARAALQTTRRERAWQNKTFYDIVSEIINDVGLTPKIDNSLRSIQMPYTTQRNISDAALLSMLAKERNAFVKYHDNEVIILPYDAEPIGRITINRSQISGFHFHEEQYHDITKVTAKYMDINAGETKRMTADAPRSLAQQITSISGLLSAGTGDSESTYILPDTYPDAITAQNAADAKLKAFQRVTQTVAINLPTLPGLFAEKLVELTGFEDAELNQRYTCRASITTLDTDGLQTILQLESIPG